VKAPTVHERWDRLQAEGEFRTGLAVPFLLLPFVIRSKPTLRGSSWPEH
jgi:hypothetical protein